MHSRAFPPALLIFVACPVAGLLNATFGNAVEMIISVFALREGLTEARQILAWVHGRLVRWILGGSRYQVASGKLT